MKKAINKFWGLLPFLIIIFCSILVAVIEKLTDNTCIFHLSSALFPGIQST